MDDDRFPDRDDASARPPPPPPAGDRELVTVLAATGTGLPLREIAVRLHGAHPVTAEWACDSRMRAHTRRLVNKARTLAEQANRDLPPAR